MPPPSTKTLSPAELAKLEHAFAADPASEAYKPLAEAYLGMGRFMEAMVVCKKGVKAHPTVPDPRLLLARVYAEQGKDKKALEELVAAMQVSPKDKNVLRMTGTIQLKTGEVDAGKANLLRAYDADPNDAETKAALEKFKVDLPRPAGIPPPPMAMPAAAPMAPTRQRVQVAPAAGNGAQAAQRDAASASAASVIVEDGPTAPQPSPAARPPPRRAPGSNGSQQQPEAPVAQQRAPRLVPRAAPPPRREEDEEVVSDLNEITDPSVRMNRAKAGSRRASFIAMLVLVPLALGGYWLYGNWRAKRNREINKDLKASTEQLKHDSYDSYKRACEAADKVLELDPASTDAHAYLAYAYTIRWGEHGGGDDARKAAEEHIEAARKTDKPASYLHAAEALFKTYSGKGAEALKELDEKVKTYNSKGQKSSLMYLTLGIIQMNAGDLEHARESLDIAQTLAPDDPRVYSALGTLLRRRGQDQEAWKNFDFALRYEKDHPESMLGKSLLILEQDNPGYVVAAKMLKKLIESEPPPSPRQLATANLARGLLVSRLSADLTRYKPEMQKELTEGTGVTTERAKNNAEVVKAEDTGFTLDRGNPELYLIKGKRLFYEDNYDGAATELKKAISIDGSRAHYHVELARVLMKKEGGAKDAEAALKVAIGQIPNSPKLMTMLGLSLMKQGKLDEALKQLGAAVEDKAAKNPEARFNMARIYKERKDWANATTAFEKAMQEYVGQTYQVAECYDNLGQIQEAKGDKAKAQENYEKALNADIDFEDVYCHYARLIASDPKSKSKAKATAEEYLKRAPKGECAVEMAKLAK